MLNESLGDLVFDKDKNDNIDRVCKPAKMGLYLKKF